MGLNTIWSCPLTIKLRLLRVGGQLRKASQHCCSQRVTLWDSCNMLCTQFIFWKYIKYTCTIYIILYEATYRNCNTATQPRSCLVLLSPPNFSPVLCLHTTVLVTSATRVNYCKYVLSQAIDGEIANPRERTLTRI